MYIIWLHQASLLSNWTSWIHGSRINCKSISRWQVNPQQLWNFVSCGRSRPSFMLQNFETVGGKIVDSRGPSVNVVLPVEGSPCTGIPMLKIRWSWDRLIFNTGIPIHGKDGHYIETRPRAFLSWSLIHGFTDQADLAWRKRGLVDLLTRTVPTSQC